MRVSWWQRQSSGVVTPGAWISLHAGIYNSVPCIGCGGHAFRNVYPTFQYAPVNLVAVCDLNSAKAQVCAKVFGADRYYSNHAEMLQREELDLVFIVAQVDETGRPQYPKLAIDCLRAGAHAWIEKPPASSSAEIQEMMRTSSETNRQVGIGFKKMFFPANFKAKEIISRPEFGPLTSITIRYPKLIFSPIKLFIEFQNSFASPVDTGRAS